MYKNNNNNVKTKSFFNQVLLKIDARRFREDNQQKIALNHDQIKMSSSVKNLIGMNFMRPKLLKIFICNIVHLVMYKMAVLSKIKSHSDPVDYFKELPLYNKPIKKPKVKRLKNIDQ